MQSSVKKREYLTVVLKKVFFLMIWKSIFLGLHQMQQSPSVERLSVSPLSFSLYLPLSHPVSISITISSLSSSLLFLSSSLLTSTPSLYFPLPWVDNLKMLKRHLEASHGCEKVLHKRNSVFLRGPNRSKSPKQIRKLWR